MCIRDSTETYRDVPRRVPTLSFSDGFDLIRRRDGVPYFGGNAYYAPLKMVYGSDDQPDLSLSTFCNLGDKGLMWLPKCIVDHGQNLDLLHVLFGSVLGLDDASLLLIASIASVTLASLALLFRPLVMECFDPAFLRGVSRWSPVAHYGFLMLVVVNLVSGFHALGTLMAVGIMILPAAAARLWTNGLPMLLLLAVLFAFGSGASGLLLSFHADVPAGPAIVLVCGVVYFVSLLAAPGGLLAGRLPVRHHLES